MSVEEPIAHLLLNLNPHSIFRLCWTNDVPCQPILTRKRSVGRILFIHACWVAVHCSLGGRFRSLRSSFCMRGGERIRSCPDVGGRGPGPVLTYGGRQFAFVTESKGLDSARRQVQSTELSSQREGWKDRNRGVTLESCPRSGPWGWGVTAVPRRA